MQSTAILPSTIHHFRRYDWPDGPGRAARYQYLRKDPGTRTPPYGHTSVGERWSLPTPVSILLTSPQLVHSFFQKYEPQSPGICVFLLLILPGAVSGAFVRGASSVLGPLLRTYAIFHASLALSIVFYRLSPFHPLAKYPGPVLAKTSKLWFVSTHGRTPECSILMVHLSEAYLGWQGKQHVHYRNLHKQYGDVVRVGMSNPTTRIPVGLNPSPTSGPNEIMLSDVSVIAPLLGPGGWGKGSCA